MPTTDLNLPAYTLDGDRVRARREELRLTQPRLAVLIGKSVATVNRIERNKLKKSVDVGTAVLLARVLGCNVEDLVKKEMAA